MIVSLLLLVDQVFQFWQLKVIFNLVMLVVQVFQLLMLVLVMQVSVVLADTFGCQFGDGCSAGICSSGRYLWVSVFKKCFINDHLFSAILRSLEQTHCTRMWFYMSDYYSFL